MEKKPGKRAPKAKNVPQKFQEMFEKGSRKNSPKPSTSKEQVIPSQEHLSEMTIADSVTNSYLFAKNRSHLNLIANPLDSNSSFLYHYCDDNNSDVHMNDNPEEQALGKLIKNYLEDNNEENALSNPPAHVFRPSASNWIEENPKHLSLQPIQKHISSSDSSLPLNTRILSPLQPVRSENETLPKLMSSLKPEIYNSDPFGNDSAEKEHVRQSIKIASQKYESALKTLENVIRKLSEPWPGRKKKLNENNVI